VKAKSIVAALMTVWLAAGTVSAQHNTDLWVGASDARVALSRAGLIPGSVYHPLSRSFFPGWSANDPGFERVTVMQGGVGPLPGSAQIWLEAVDLDPAFIVIDNTFKVLDSPGDMTLLGGADLHTHLTWFVDETDPGFDLGRCVWEATFTLVDTGSGLRDSLPFTLLFTNVPVRGGSFPPIPTRADGDFEEDGDVDAWDHAAFAECGAGPDRRPAPDDPAITTCEVRCFNAFDFNDDLDVDLADYAELQNASTGPG
jgi:hypothetical protein